MSSADVRNTAGSGSGHRPTSLPAAEMWLATREPPIGATLADRQTWHELCAEIYAAVAESDPRHEHEARALAALAREEAVRVTALIAARDAAKSLGGPERGER